MTAHPEKTFQALFEAEYNQLCRLALTYMQDEHAAEDVVQDTFIKIWERKQDLISSPDIRYYLVMAVRNNCISALRKQKSSNITFPESAPNAEPEPFMSQMLHREEAADRQKKLSEALDKLPPKCKEVFLMVKLNGLSYKQVAEALDISVKTVENQMGKALKTLREHAAMMAMLIFLFSPMAALAVWLYKSLLF